VTNTNEQHDPEYCDDPNCPVCGPEPTYEEWVAEQIGPRQVGGRYRTYTGYEYQVLEIEPGPRPTWPTWRITIRGVEDGTERWHCTAWDERDQVLTGEARSGHKTWLDASVAEWPAGAEQATAQAVLQALEPNGREG